MFCLNCKNQIPDDADRCPNCGTEVFHKQQLAKEISFRRYQRWIFYGIIIILFVGMVVIVVKIYNTNARLLLEVTNTQADLNSKATELTTAKDSLSKSAQQLLDIQKTMDDIKKSNTNDLATKDQQLAAQVEQLNKTVSDKALLTSQYETLVAYFNNLSASAVGISNEDLGKIKVADVSYGGTDTDLDGLPDDMEAALGTDPNKIDTDGDGYNDKAEVIGGFDPLKAGANLPIDQAFANKQKGRVFKQVFNGSYLWAIGENGFRYFLGKF